MASRARLRCVGYCRGNGPRASPPQCRSGELEALAGRTRRGRCLGASRVSISSTKSLKRRHCEFLSLENLECVLTEFYNDNFLNSYVRLTLSLLISSRGLNLTNQTSKVIFSISLNI